MFTAALSQMTVEHGVVFSSVALTMTKQHVQGKEKKQGLFHRYLVIY